MTEAAELLDGARLKIGRREYIVPPLNLRGVKRAQVLIPALAREGDPAAVDAAVEILHLAVARNYPEVTREQLEDEVDLGNLNQLVEAVLAIAGFHPKAPGETVAPPS